MGLHWATYTEKEFKSPVAYLATQEATGKWVDLGTSGRSTEEKERQIKISDMDTARIPEGNHVE